MNIQKSEQAFQEANNILAGGVNSPVRSFSHVGGSPIFMEQGQGSHIRDIDGNDYIDFCMSWGALILGHANPKILTEVTKVISKGTSFGCPTLYETELANLVSKAIPSIEKVRFVSSGTEAVMSAVRLARGFTKRNKIVKFDGCYHGHSDNLLVNAGSGVAEISSSSSKGIPSDTTKHTISLPFNDIDQFNTVLEKHAQDIACVILEPIPANMGLILPNIEFIKLLRKQTHKHGIVLIFDEVISGFRVGYGGAQERLGIKPDLTTLGKIIGGGFPVGAFGGRKDIMTHLAPEGDVYQAGTLSGNPVAMTAGIATLRDLNDKTIYEELERKVEYLKSKLNAGIKIHNYGSLFYIYNGKKEQPLNLKDVAETDTNTFGLLHDFLLKKGIYTSPSLYEVNFLSIQHSKTDIDKYVSAVNAFYEENLD